jgi:hypothetical protein
VVVETGCGTISAPVIIIDIIITCNNGLLDMALMS